MCVQNDKLLDLVKCSILAVPNSNVFKKYVY